MLDFLIQHAGTIFACSIAFSFLMLVLGEFNRKLYP